MQALRLAFLSSFFLILTGCGTTSNLKPTDTATGAKSTLNLTGYNKIIVLNLKDNELSKPFKGGETFSNHIAAELAKTKTFSVISRTRGNDRALLIDGEVTNYDKGNAVMRMMVGFTAGNSNFDATVNVSDSQTGKKVGTILVDKNSWALGGMLAATQTVESLMQAAATKVAEELNKAKKGNAKVASVK